LSDSARLNIALVQLQQKQQEQKNLSFLARICSSIEKIGEKNFMTLSDRASPILKWKIPLPSFIVNPNYPKKYLGNLFIKLYLL